MIFGLSQVLLGNIADLYRLVGLVAGFAAACLLGGGPYAQIIGCLSNLPKSSKTLVFER